MEKTFKAVLFDLDGTLADTAPDLADALNQVMTEESRPPLDYQDIRPVVSHGAMAMIKRGFGITPEDENFDRIKQRLLDIYHHNICQKTDLFPGIKEVLSHLEERQILWGIVTNKPTWLTQPLVEQLQIKHRAASIVCGDTLSTNKPHPAPLLHACDEMQIEAQDVLYVGDAARDIEAGRRAGMMTLAALYGYIEEDDPNQWNADYMIEQPIDVLEYLSVSSVK